MAIRRELWATNKMSPQRTDAVNLPQNMLYEHSITKAEPNRRSLASRRAADRNRRTPMPATRFIWSGPCGGAPVPTSEGDNPGPADRTEQAKWKKTDGTRSARRCKRKSEN